MNAPAWLRGARAATIFLTRIPVGGFPFSADDWRWSSAYFPLVGFGLGVIQALIFALFLRAGTAASATVMVIASLLLTGAFHEDGLADTADALGGAYTREKLFEILKDSRVGSFGASALALALLLRVLLVARLGEHAAVAIVMTQGLSRVPPIWLMRFMPYVTMDAAAKSRTVARAGAAQLTVATLTGLCAGALAYAVRRVTGLELAGMAAAATGITFVAAFRFWKRARGITGDFLGATQQVVELALLLALTLVRGGVSP